MNLLFLEVDRVVVKDFSNNLNIQLNSMLSNNACSVINKIVSQHDFYIVLTSNSLDSYTEKESFACLSKLGLPVDRFLTKLTVNNKDILTVISEYLSKRSDVDLYFILNNVNNISNYSPYVYSSINVLTERDFDIINTQISILNNNKEVAKDYSSDFFKKEMKKSVQDEYKVDMVNTYKDEVKQLISNDKDKFASKSGFKLLTKNYGKYISQEDLIAIYKSFGVHTFSYILKTRVIPLTIIVSLVFSIFVYFITHNLLLLLSVFPIFFFLYSFSSEVAEVRHKGL